MFLHLLTPDQQRLFIRAFRAVAEQDGSVAHAEEVLHTAVLAECNLEEEPWQTESVEALSDDLAAAFNSALPANIFALELAGVAVVDGEAHPSEVETVRSLVAPLGISAERLDEFFEFALRARELAADGEALISTGTGI